MSDWLMNDGYRADVISDGSGGHMAYDDANGAWMPVGTTDSTTPVWWGSRKGGKPETEEERKAQLAKSLQIVGEAQAKKNAAKSRRDKVLAERDRVKSASWVDWLKYPAVVWIATFFSGIIILLSHYYVGVVKDVLDVLIVGCFPALVAWPILDERRDKKLKQLAVELAKSETALAEATSEFDRITSHMSKSVLEQIRTE